MSFATIVQFVERKISANEFLEKLYNDAELETTLSEQLKTPPYSDIDNVYLYLLENDLQTPAGMSNSLGVLERFLIQKEIPFEKNVDAEKIYDIVYKAQPKWLDLPDWYLKKYLLTAKGKSDKDLLVFLKERIKQDFRCLKNPPKWLQSPKWIFENEKPLIFVNQIEITPLRHDTSHLYIFYDDKEDKFHFVEQSM